MKRTIAALVAATVLTVAPAHAVTTCADEVTGEPGLPNGTGECITPAEYDALFSYENLSTIPSLTNPSLSIAEEAGLEPTSPAASDRPLGVGLVETTFTFRELVTGNVAL